ncbi:clathrin light chain 2-like [Euphorbia lathyris]|uniref:clathrin light chain 2-like n=1 Tax=Euphorbia lathyris TaxID=212925 RepID=UPI0033141CBA
MSTFSEFDDSVPQTESTPPPFEDDNNGEYTGYNPQEFESFTGAEDVYESHPTAYSADEQFEAEENGSGFAGDFGGSDGPTLPPPSEMAEEGLALREWRKENAIVLEEKEKREKELLSQIIQEAEEFKVEFYKKREIGCENNKTTNREKEKVVIANQENFHTEADKHYWKAIAELIPNEVPTIEKKRGKKDQDKKPGIVVVQGPKPGKPTELSRMRQILIKLKHNTPPHLKHSPPPPVTPKKDAKTGDEAAAAAKTATVVTTPEPVAVA